MTDYKKLTEDALACGDAGYLYEALEQAEKERDAAIEHRSKLVRAHLYEQDRADAAEADRDRLAAALEQVANARLHNMPGINPDGSVSSSTMAECLAREALAASQEQT